MVVLIKHLGVCYVKSLTWGNILCERLTFRLNWSEDPNLHESHIVHLNEWEPDSLWYAAAVLLTTGILYLSDDALLWLWCKGGSFCFSLEEQCLHKNFERCDEIYDCGRERKQTNKSNKTIADTPIPPEVKKTQTSQTGFQPYKSKYRKPGTGGVYQLNDHLWEGKYSPRDAHGKRISRNVYAKTEEECEAKLEELIKQMKKEIAAEKEKLGVKNQ